MYGDRKPEFDDFTKTLIEGEIYGRVFGRAPVWVNVCLIIVSIIVLIYLFLKFS